MLRLVPVLLKPTNDFILRHHRHHKKDRGCRAVVGVEDGELRGVGILGRPKSKVIQNTEPYTAEVTRCCTDGTRNACSMIYGALARAAAAMGYRKVITYVLETEDGASLRAAGWSVDRKTRGGSWDTPARRRDDNAPTCPKIRWVKELG